MTKKVAYRFFPTWRWLLCLLVSFAVLFAAINYQKNALHWLAYACWSLIVLGTIYSWWNARHWHWEWSTPEFAFADQDWSIASNQDNILGIFGPGDLDSANCSVKTTTIGLLALRVSTWTTEYPLGLFKVKYRLPPPSAVWIYPQPLNHRHFQQNAVHEPEWTDIRGYQQGDRPKLLVRKTQALPMAYWQVRGQDDATIAHEDKNTDLNWASLPEHWTLLEKLQQLSYDIEQLSEHVAFSCTLPHGHLPLGRGAPHKHLAWKMLAQEWEHWS